jgi:hypothetical protein
MPKRRPNFGCALARDYCDTWRPELSSLMFKLQNPLTSHESPDELNWLFLDSERVIGPTAYGTVSIGKEEKKRYGERLLVCAQTRSLVESFPNMVRWLLTYRITALQLRRALSTNRRTRSDVCGRCATFRCDPSETKRNPRK